MWPFIRPSSTSSSLRHRLLHTLVEATRVTLRSSASENATRLTTVPDSAALFCETLNSPEASTLAPTLFYDVPRRQVFSVNLALGVFRRHSLYAEAAERLLAEKSNRLQIRHVPLGAAVPLPVPLSSAEASALSCHFFHQLGFSDSDRRLFQRNLASRLLAPAFVSAFSLSFSPGIHDEQEQEAPQREEEETPQAEGFKSELVGWEKVNSDQLCETARRLLTGFVEGKRAQETLEEMGLREAFAPRDGLLGSFLSKAALPVEAIPLIHPPPPLGVEVKGMAEAEMPEDYVYRPLVETQQAIELVNKLVRDRRFLDAILTLEEWALQELDPASLQPLRKLVTEAMSKDTVLKFWPTLEAKQASLLLEVSTSALLLSEASRLTSMQARRWLDRLRGIDSILIERDHVLEALKGLCAGLCGDHEAAEQYLLEALRQNPRLVVVHKLLGDVYLRLHQPSKAWLLWEASLEMAEHKTEPARLLHASLYANVLGIQQSLDRFFD